ncbi:DUF3347 domain-containing protein [Pedobacter antarcticus]|uniref:DUF3347 domain-containing protein n=1 Tax=Pedobacter antarcticus TaxID=34086 RepID=UPI001C5A4C8E|nr:DUF3347 domain-containing protein [Pedobacter antarcticus]
MKTLIYIMALSVIFITACGNNNRLDRTTQTGVIKTVSDSAKNASRTTLFNLYFKLKNSFAADNDTDAANAAKEMIAAFAGFKANSLTPEQSKAFSEIKEDATEHVSHISANAGNIVHQREHFDMLSKDMYDLAKLTGTGQVIYVDHCPMYNHNKGALWLSEVKEIRNPYMGKAMPVCGKIQEELKL